MRLIEHLQKEVTTFTEYFWSCKCGKSYWNKESTTKIMFIRKLIESGIVTVNGKTMCDNCSKTNN